MPTCDTGTAETQPTQVRIRDPFDVDSEVARDLRAVDWAATALGAPETWPQSLQTIVRTLLTSRFSMWMAWGPDLTFFCNEAYRRDTLGKKYPWALGRSAREVWAEIWPDIGPRIETVMRTGQATWDEALLLFLERSGFVEETYHTFSYSPLADDRGVVVGMLCVVTEDTERVIAERRMALLRDLGAEAAAIRNEPELYAVVGDVLARDQQSLPFTLTYVYDEAGTRADLVCTSGIAPGDPAAPRSITLADPHAAWPAAAVHGGHGVVADGLVAQFPDLPTGAWPDPPVQALVVPVRQQGQDTPIGFLVVGADPYRPLDEGYRAFVDLIAGQLGAGVSSARAYDAERRRADALADLDRAKTTFFTNISHEFRTPLTLLLGPAEDALADGGNPLPPLQRERVGVIHRNGQRLLKLVNTLLDFSRLESGRMNARFEPVDVAHETADLASAFRSAVERVGLTLTVEVSPLGEPVYLDREMWAKVVLNLLSNALKFTFDGGITVSARRDGDQAVVTVADTGTGIPPEHLSRLFERFHRVAGAKARTHEGSGIGLALVSELVSLHDGTVSVDSAVGEGTTFTIRLPFGRAHLPAEHVSTVPAAVVDADRVAQGFLAEADRWLAVTPSGDPAAAEGLPRVLVVDDNADMRDYIARLLSSDYAVLTAGDGVEALDTVRSWRPDLVLTDVMMPRMDGFQLLARLRDDHVTSDIPVVMLSARAGDEATAEGLEAGADDYLVKPFAARELRARVRANLELDRVRRSRAELERNRALLDQAQRLAGLGSWEFDLATGRFGGSAEFYRLLGLPPDKLDGMSFAAVVAEIVHPDDQTTVEEAFAAAVDGAALEYTVRVHVDGSYRLFHALGELVRDPEGTPVRLHGSVQDITEQRATQEAMAAAVAATEAAAREQLIADELQRSLLPPPAFSPDHLNIATYYRAGVAGTYVGGDWYDVIELGAGRTALVVGDVMGRGVRAAAVMGQLRAAIRAYTRLDLTPTDVLEFLDAVVRDLGDDHIVTCVYAVYDPGERSLSYANAGHVPPLVLMPGQAVHRLTTAGPPLGTGVLRLEEDQVTLPTGAVLALYTDGLVENRRRDVDTGITDLAGRLAELTAVTDDAPRALVEQMLPSDPDDDVAMLLAQVHDDAERTRSLAFELPADERAVQNARERTGRALEQWGVAPVRVDDIVLLASELVTNAIVHGRPPIEVRLRTARGEIVLDVRDHASYLPRRLHPTTEDEHGRGLQLVALLADRWGTRPVAEGKSVWCVCSVSASPLNPRLSP